jgi:hypothetical protein
MKTLRKLEKWFDLNVAWLFINGRKREWWNEYINDKYFKDI